MAERGALEKHAPEICQGQKDDHTSGLHGEMTCTFPERTRQSTWIWLFLQ